MATCSELLTELNEQRGYINQILASSNPPSNISSITDIGTLQAAANRIQPAFGGQLSDLGDIKTYLTDLISRASRINPPCNQVINDARAIMAQVDSKINSLAQAFRQIESRISQLRRETRQSTESTNNQGTGTPGTAGQGPDASKPAVTNIPRTTETTTPDSDLQEFTVTGSKPNNKLIIPPDPNVPSTAGDINVTAPNLNLGTIEDGSDQNLEEVTVTGRRNPDELEEVTVTGRRNPDELEEVTVTARRPNSTTGATDSARNQASTREETNFPARKDWRVRLALAPGSTYLYNDNSNELLSPLRTSNGVIFPYTPSVQVTYGANYQATDPTHSNYKFFQYENSYVDNILIGCDFTAQDTEEAQYLLAVIHFFRSATKMFYGQDQNPKPGTPPPMCFLYGFGEFQFNAHPLAITNFNYNLPSDVDYIRVGGPADITTGADGLEEVTVTGKKNPNIPNKPAISKGWGQIAQDYIQGRLGQGVAAIGNAIGLKLQPGGALNPPNWVQTGFKPAGFNQLSNPTYVPTKINLQISCIPLMSRYETSNVFSLKDYANGNLIRGYGSQGRKGAGHW